MILCATYRLKKWDGLRENSAYSQYRFARGASQPGDGAVRRAHFPNVTLRIHEDDLVVTEAKPLVDYILSAWSFRHADEEAPVERFTAFVERALRDHGEIRISKNAGVFIASRN